MKPAGSPLNTLLSAANNNGLGTVAREVLDSVQNDPETVRSMRSASSREERYQEPVTRLVSATRQNKERYNEV